MEDDNSMSERILRTIESILSNDTELKEFSVIPAESNTKNKSPVHYEEHNIGLESWCIKHIYRYAYLELFEVRKQLNKRKLSFCKEQNLNHLLVGVLLINPDVSTFWNMKRQLVENDVLGVGHELAFSKIVLSYKSKSNEAFAYRRWLLQRVLAKLDANDLDTPQNLLQNELGVCEMAATKNSNNYHAWTHRIWCMERLGVRVANFHSIIATQLEFSHRWLLEHVSEHTSYHYRQYLFNFVRKSGQNNSVFEFYYNQVVGELKLVNDNDPRDLLTFLLGKSSGKSLEQTANFINFVCLLLYDLYNTLELLNSIYLSHESIFYHRKYLVYQLVKTAHDYHGLIFNDDEKIGDGTSIVTLNTSELNDGEKKPKLFKSQPNKVQNSMLYRLLVEHEMEFVRKNLNRDPELTRKYEKWLKFVVRFDDQ